MMPLAILQRYAFLVDGIALLKIECTSLISHVCKHTNTQTEKTGIRDNDMAMSTTQLLPLWKTK